MRLSTRWAGVPSIRAASVTLTPTLSGAAGSYRRRWARAHRAGRHLARAQLHAFGSVGSSELVSGVVTGRLIATRETLRLVPLRRRAAYPSSFRHARLLWLALAVAALLATRRKAWSARPMRAGATQPVPAAR
jgi:hypothetical protein